MTTLGSLTVKLGLDPSQFRDGMATAEVELGVFKGAVDSNGSSIDDFSKKLLTGTKAVVGFAAKIGSFASAAISAAPYVVKAAQSVYSFGAAAVQASPMVLGIAAAGLFVKETFTRIMPDILKSFNPFMQALTDAGNRAGLLASAGIAPLTQKFAQLNMPAISAGMNEIAKSTNGVLKGTLAWTNSAAGIMAIRNIVQSSGDAFATVAPHIQSVVIALGNMLGRITAVSTAAGASGLSGVLDKLTAWMNKVDAASVLSGIDKLKADFVAIKSAIENVIDTGEKLYSMWQQNKVAIGQVQDGIAVLAIVMGGPLGAAAAVVGLLIRHWSELSGVVGPVIGPIVTAVQNLLNALAPLVPTIATMVVAFLTGLIPVINTVTAILHVLVPIIQIFGPALALIAPIVLASIVAWSALTKVFTAVQAGITAVKIVLPMLATLFTETIPSIVSATAAGAVWVAEGIAGAASYAASLAVTVAESVAGFIAMGIEALASAAEVAAAWVIAMGPIGWAIAAVVGLVALIVANWDTVKSITADCWNFVSGIVVGAWNFLTNAIGTGISNEISLVASLPGRILGALGDLGSLLYNAGVSVIQGLINGIENMLGSLGSAASSVASTIASYLPFSPAKRGPLSGHGSPSISGGKIASMVASGMMTQLPAVAAASEALANAVGMPGGAGYGSITTPRGALAATGAAAGGGAAVVQLQGTDAILQLMRKLVRDNGGTADLAFSRRR